MLQITNLYARKRCNSDQTLKKTFSFIKSYIQLNIQFESLLKYYQNQYQICSLQLILEEHMPQVLEPELLIVLFDSSAEHIHLKRSAIQHLQNTFQKINQNNFGEYIDYLVEWTLFQVNPSCLQAFIHKIKDLQIYIENNHPKLLERMIIILFYLLQQDDEHVRKIAIQVCIQIFRTKLSHIYVKKSITQLLESQNHYSGFDSALALYCQFHSQFANKEFSDILGHKCFFQTFKTKKIFLLRMLQMCNQVLQMDLISYLLPISLLYIKEQDEMIHCLGIKLRINLLSKGIKYQLTNSSECMDQLNVYYAESFMRTKFTIIQVTQQIVTILPPHLIRKHYEYLKNNIIPQESEITELVIEKLRVMFQFISKDQRKALMLTLIKLDKQDHHIGDAIAKNLTELLLEEENQSTLIDNLKQFIEEQRDVVKLSFIKSFFKYKKSNHWYNFLLDNLQQLMDNKIWRVRLESLQILKRVMEIFPVSQQMFPTLKVLMFDRVSRIRLQTIKLIAICIQQQNIYKRLIPSILQESSNGNYLFRETVLFFIRETYLMVPDTVKELYKECIQSLKNDPIQNVREVAIQIFESY